MMSWGARYCRTDSAARCDRASLIFYTLADYFELHVQPSLCKRKLLRRLPTWRGTRLGNTPTAPQAQWRSRSGMTGRAGVTGQISSSQSADISKHSLPLHLVIAGEVRDRVVYGTLSWNVFCQCE